MPHLIFVPTAHAAETSADISRQTTLVLATLDERLRSHRSSLADAVVITVYLRDAADFGAMNEAYPLRQKMLKFHVEGSYPIEYHRHPGYYCGYNYDKDASIGPGYAQRIRNCRVGFADSVFPFAYLVAKFFEIPATGALLLADDTVSKYLNELGFVAERDYIPVSLKSLEERIEYVLDESNRERLDQVRRNGQTLTHERHKTSDRARRINEVCSA